MLAMDEKGTGYEKVPAVATDPPVSEAQNRAMHAAAAGKSTLGIPKKVGEEFVGKDAKGHAAGLLFVAPDGDILTLRRSGDESNYAGHWALPGGKGEDGESPDQIANREAREEMGDAIPNGPLKHLDSRMTPTGMAFHTFVQPVGSKFVPKLNEEHSGYAWAPMHQLPSPLHPGVSATLSERLMDNKTSNDMSPEDWKGLREGFAKWAHEEEQEEAHAEDVRYTKDQQRRLMIAWESGKSDRARGKSKEEAIGSAPRGSEIAMARADGWEGKSIDWWFAPDQAADAYSYSAQIEGAAKLRKEMDEIDAKIAALRAQGASNRDTRLIQLMRDKHDLQQKIYSANDSCAMDKDTIRSYDKDGRLHVSLTPISKANVCQYYGREIPGGDELGLDPDKVYKLLRDPQELAKAAPTFNNLPLLSEHVPLSADAHESKLVVGSTGTDAVWGDPYLRNSLVVWPREAITAIENDEQKELSSAYHYRADMTPGTFKGEAYDGVMRDIVGNHVALVKQGRAGSDVVVGDTAFVKLGEAMSFRAFKNPWSFSGFKPDHITFDAFVPNAQRLQKLKSDYEKLKRVLASLPPGSPRYLKDEILDDMSELESEIAREEGAEDASTPPGYADLNGQRKPTVINKGQPWTHDLRGKDASPDKARKRESLKKEIAELERSLDTSNPNTLRGANARSAASADLYEARKELRALGEDGNPVQSVLSQEEMVDIARKHKDTNAQMLKQRLSQSGWSPSVVQAVLDIHRSFQRGVRT